jgi:cobalt-zinc-cadmium efflux system membrane fusion protein
MNQVFIYFDKGIGQRAKPIFSSLFKQSIIPLLSCIVLFSCHHPKAVLEQNNFELQGDTIIVPKQSTIAPKLTIRAIHTEPYRFELLTAGTVKAIPNLYAQIAPPFAGRVTKVLLKLGMKVHAGTPLFELTSREFIDAQKLFFQAKSELLAAQLTLKRQQDLKKNEVGTERDLEEAKTNFEIREKEYQNAIASLKIFGVDINKIIIGQPLVVTSPITGEIISNTVVMGQYIKAEDPPYAIVAELNKVWVAGMVKEKDIHFINQLAGATINIAAFPEKKIIGKIFHVNEIVDEETRSVQVLIECPNNDHILKPGMYVNVNFINTPSTNLFVPAKSVLQFNDKSFVFVEVGQGKYLKRFVETGITDNGRIAITVGLHEGEKIIEEGAFYLLDAK